jgi:hypothetical protein
MPSGPNSRVAGMIGILVQPAVAVACCHAKQVPYGDHLVARRRGAGQLGQMRQYGVVQAERAVALEHADRQRRHGLRHREHITADVIDPAALATRTAVNDDLDGIYAQPPGIRGLPEPVERGAESHRLTLLACGPRNSAMVRAWAASLP